MAPPFKQRYSLLGELRRRHVFRVAALCIVGAWLLLQIADVTFPGLGKECSAGSQYESSSAPVRIEFCELWKEKENTMTSMIKPPEGGCTCGHVRYQLTSNPLIVHCCHCLWCQRQTGSAFAINALFVADDVELLKGEIKAEMVDSPSGKGQRIARCPKCDIAVWSNYFMGGIREGIRFIRVGTLDVPDQLPPDVHIYTSTKQSWVQLPDDAHVEDSFYDYKTTWTPENLVRLQALRDAAKTT